MARIETQTRTLAQFVSENKITATVEWADSNPNMEPSRYMHRHFKVTLKMGRSRMTIPFSQGDLHTEEPTAEDVLSCLASDSASIEQEPDFAAWARSLGWDEDSRKAERCYKNCEKQRDKLRQLLGEDLYQELLYHTEPL